MLLARRKVIETVYGKVERIYFCRRLTKKKKFVQKALSPPLPQDQMVRPYFGVDDQIHNSHNKSMYFITLFKENIHIDQLDVSRRVEEYNMKRHKF